jgi:hypothetical protein
MALASRPAWPAAGIIGSALWTSASGDFLFPIWAQSPRAHDVTGLCRAVPKLRTIIVTGRRPATSIPKLIDVALSGDIEPMPVPADGRVGRGS